MKKTRSLILLLGWLSLAGTCGRSGAGAEFTSPEDQFREAMELYKAKKYRKAAEAFKDVALRATVNPYTDDAEYYLGMSYLLSGQKEKARGAFSAVITSFPGSEFAPLAYIGLARAQLAEAPAIPRDQKKTRDAIETLETFLKKYPDHEKVPEAKALLQECRERLAKKDLIAIEVYENLMKYQAELHYTDLFLKEYPQSKYRWDVLLHKARALYYLNRDDEALQALGEIESSREAPGDLRAEARKLRLSIVKRAGSAS